MANSNLLFQKEADEARAAGRSDLPKLDLATGNDNVSVFPNPVTGNQFRMSFDDNTPGNYNIVLSDLAGRVLFTKVVNVQAKRQVETISLKSKPAQGMYLIKVIDSEKKTIFSDKLLIN